MAVGLSKVKSELLMQRKKEEEGDQEGDKEEDQTFSDIECERS